jgi:hypothetical protein
MGKLILTMYLDMGEKEWMMPHVTEIRMRHIYENGS